MAPPANSGQEWMDRHYPRQIPRQYNKQQQKSSRNLQLKQLARQEIAHAIPSVKLQESSQKGPPRPSKAQILEAFQDAKRHLNQSIEVPYFKRHTTFYS